MEMDDSNGCTLQMHLMPLNCTLRNSSYGKFYAVCFYHKKIKLGPCPHKCIFWQKKTRSAYKQTTLIQCDTIRIYTREPNLAREQGMKGFSKMTFDLYFKGQNIQMKYSKIQLDL